MIERLAAPDFLLILFGCVLVTVALLLIVAINMAPSKIVYIPVYKDRIRVEEVCGTFVKPERSIPPRHFIPNRH